MTDLRLYNSTDETNPIKQIDVSTNDRHPPIDIIFCEGWTSNQMDHLVKYIVRDIRKYPPSIVWPYVVRVEARLSYRYNLDDRTYVNCILRLINTNGGLRDFRNVGVPL